MNATTTTELVTLAYAAEEALSHLDRLCDRCSSVPDEVYLARENLVVLRDSLKTLTNLSS